MKSVQSDLLTVPEAAEIVGVSRAYIARLAKEGRIRALLKGKVYLITESALESYMRDRNRKRSASKAG